MQKLFRITSILLVVFILNGCKRDNELPQVNNTIAGYAQKGPFLNGSSITVYELSSNYSQTGKTFLTQIANNTGRFNLSNINLLSNYVQIKADGFYFNEVCGSNSIAPLTLNCIADIGNSNSIHVNVLTHLEKPRVEFLLGSGMSFDSAKIKAQREVLAIFNISLVGIDNSEYLDISQSGDGNAILLGVSAILQGFRSESELSSLLALISNDIRNDGMLNDSNAMSSLIDQTLLLDTVSIRSNVLNFYLNLGMTVSIPHFETYIQEFINTTTFPITHKVLNYPLIGNYGDNILFPNKLIYSVDSSMSLAVDLKTCSSIKVRINGNPGTWIGWQIGTEQNWTISPYVIAQERIFTSISPNSHCDLHIILWAGTYLIEYYEMNSSLVTFSKTITVI
ncbi:MAG: hypothetical protein IPP46_20210 [Bacteroidetes bacterium]|nr:hypothetical protein [Bacteroidota bacterium]